MLRSGFLEVVDASVGVGMRKQGRAHATRQPPYFTNPPPNVADYTVGGTLFHDLPQGEGKETKSLI